MLRYSFKLILLSVTWFAMSISLSCADDDAALTLISIQGCKGCHILDEQGGTLGPKLDGIGSRLTFEQIKQKLINPEKTSKMPNYRHLTVKEQDLLIRYLSHLR